MDGMAAYICSNIAVTCPPIRSCAPAAPLLYGAWIMSMPAACANSAPLGWCVPPMPPEA